MPTDQRRLVRREPGSGSGGPHASDPAPAGMARPVVRRRASSPVGMVDASAVLPVERAGFAGAGAIIVSVALIA